MSVKSPQPGVQTHDFPALELRAAFSPKSVNEESRTVEVVWTTGEKVLRSGYDGHFFEELSLDPKHIRMERLNSGRAPLLANHNGQSLDAVIGVIERVNGTTLIARFAKDDPAAEAAWNKVRQGVLGNVSVGYRVHKFEKVDGTDPKVPTFRATDWEPYEVSLVPMGADSAAHVRSSEAATKNPCVFITRGEQPQQEEAKMTDEEIKAAAEKAALEARQAELKQATDTAAKLERERSAGIYSAVDSLKLERSLADDLVNKGVSLAEARAAILEAAVKRSDAAAPSENAQHGAISVTDDAKDKFARGAESWLLEKAGQLSTVRQAETLESYSGKMARKGLSKVDVGAGQFRGASLSDMARMFLESRGIRTNTHDRVRLFEAAFNYRSSYQGTSDFAVLFENVMYKTVLAAYETQEDVWQRFCGVKEVQDFRPSNFFRTGSFGVLQPLNEHGEFQNTAIPDGQKSSISVSTYGDIIAISRQSVINDDMGVILDMAAQRGRDARTTIEDKVFTMLALNSGLGPTQTDSQAFFHANRSNVNSSATANTAAGWDADAQVMGNQTDISGNHKLNLVPEVLLLSRSKRMEAQVLNASSVKVGGSNGEPNPASGMAKDIVSTTRLAGNRRYWFANPARNPAIVVSFLAGSGSAPVLSSAEGFRVDGTEFKTRLDFGVTFFDPKCAVTNAGA